jgi:hypothetical protein
LSFNNFGTGGGLRKTNDGSKRLVAASGVDSNSRQSGLDGKERETQEDAQDYVTKALNPFGKSHIRLRHHETAEVREGFATVIHLNAWILFCNPILFAICTSTFSKLCKEH